MMVGRVYTKSTKPKRKAAPKPITPTTVTGRRVKRLKVSKPAKSRAPKAAVAPKKVAKARKAVARKTPKDAAKPKSSATGRALSHTKAKTPKP